MKAAKFKCATLATLLAGLSIVMKEVQPPDPVPPAAEQAACPSSHAKNNAGIITKIGESTKLDRAKERAKSEVKDALAALPQTTAVVCANCPNGIQCPRSIAADNIVEGECECDSVRNHYYCSASHTGAYTVNCADC